MMQVIVVVVAVFKYFFMVLKQFLYPNPKNSRQITKNTETPNNKKQMFPKKLKQNLSSYSSQKESQTLHLLLDLKLDDPGNQQHIVILNEEIENVLQCGLYDMVEHYGIGDMCSLVVVLMEAVDGNRCLRWRVVIWLLDSVVDIYGGNLLSQVLEVLVNQDFARISRIAMHEKHRLHKLINQSLKKLPKTAQITILRGKLHILLTKILQIYHRSGMTTCFPTETPFPLIPFQQYSRLYSFFQIPYQFYSSYLEIYNRLQAPLDIGGFNGGSGLVINGLEGVEGGGGGQLMDCFWERLRVVMERFVAVGARELLEDDSLVCMFPTPENLIQNIDGLQFRLLLMLKLIIYFRVLKIKIDQSRHPDNQPLHTVREIIDKIERDCEDYIKKLLSKSATEQIQLMDMLNHFHRNENIWIEIKAGNLKNVIKLFSHTKSDPSTTPQTSISISQSDKSIQSQSQQQSNHPSQPLTQAITQLHKQISTKLNINSHKTQYFLQHQQQPVLQKKATTPSFSAFNNSFIGSDLVIKLNYEELEEEEEEEAGNFQDVREFHFVKWKAMRCLLRERLSVLGEVNFGVGGGEMGSYFFDGQDTDV